MLSRTMAFLFGVLVLQQFAELPPWPWMAGLLVFILAAALLCRNHWLSVAVAACFGFLWATCFGHWQLSKGLDTALEGQELLVQGVIASLPENHLQRTRFLFRPEKAWMDGREVSVPTKLRLSWYNDFPKTLHPGQQWRFLVKLKRPWGMMNPGGFDYEGWLFAEGIRATGYVRRSAENRLLTDSSWQMPLQRLRFGLYKRLRQTLENHPSAGVIIALALGERDGISDEQWNMLLASGTNHLVAISGLHVGLVSGLIFFLARALWRRCPLCCLRLPAPKAGALAALIAAVAYAALAGFSLPTQRALLMLAIGLGAIILQRPVLPLRALCLALWGVLLWQPTAVLSAGFWLSFAAVAIILFSMGGRLRPSGLWWRWGRVQVVVSLGLMPLLLIFFGNGSLSAPLANLIAVPLVSFLIVPLTLLGVTVLPLHEEFGGFLLRTAADLCEMGWPFLSWVTEHVPAVISVAPDWTLVPALAGGIWWLMPRGWPLRSVGVALLLPMLVLQPPQLETGRAEVTLLDVGQGLSAVVQTRHHTLVFDTGPRSLSGFNTGDAVILPFLREKGVRQLDTLIVSHGDNDHIGGARSLLKGIAVGRVLTGVPQKMTWVSNEACHAGQSWRWDGVSFRILHPPAGYRHGSGNNSSCVLRVTAGKQSVLLPGDIERRAEMQLVSDSSALQSEVLIAPHHGSKTSSSEAFITAVDPEWVLYPVGYRNRYGFPRPDITQRYQSHSVHERESFRSGALTFMLGDDKAIVPVSYRRAALRYWHSR